MSKKFMGVVLVCKTCGEKFKVSQGRKDTAKYCSQKCASPSIVFAKEKVAIICVECGKVFYDSPSHAERRVTCSKACDRLQKRKNMLDIECAHCHAVFSVKASHAKGRKYCSSKCLRAEERLRGRESTKGSLNPCWRGGKVESSNGYILVHVPNHPFASAQGYVLEHRLVMEDALRKIDPKSSRLVKVNGVGYLAEDVLVHHKNGRTMENNIENLEILSRSEHARRHEIWKKAPQAVPIGSANKLER